MFALVLSAALATAPAPAPMNCNQPGAAQMQMSTTSGSMGSMPGMAGHGANSGYPGRTKDLYAGRK